MYYAANRRITTFSITLNRARICRSYYHTKSHTVVRYRYSFLTVCDEHHWGMNCSTECRCGVGASSCHAVSGCVCMDGWTGTLCDRNKNECETGVASCIAKSTCVDTPGSYECMCWTGLKFNETSNACEGISLSLSLSLSLSPVNLL